MNKIEELEFSININAMSNKVWTVLWSDISYTQWKSAFGEGYFYEGEFEEGNVIRFLESHGNGIYSKITEMSSAEKVTFLHLGEIYEGLEIPQDWEGVQEKYLITEKDNQSTLKVQLRIPEEWKIEYEEHFPKALQNIKHLAENQL